MLPAFRVIKWHFPFQQRNAFLAQCQFLTLAGTVSHRKRHGRWLHGQRGIEFDQCRFNARMQALVNGVDLGVVGNAFERNVRHRLVYEATLESFMRVTQGKVIKAGGHQALLSQRNGDARGVAGDPAAPPLFSHVGGGATAAGGIEHEVARVGTHQHATLYYLVQSLYAVDNVFGTRHISP